MIEGNSEVSQGNREGQAEGKPVSVPSSGQPEQIFSIDETPLLRVERESPIELRREWVAAALALGLLGLLVLLMISPFVYWFTRGSPLPSEMIDYVKSTVAVVAGLLGAVLGFYFSQKRLR